MDYLILKSYRGCQPGCVGRNCVSKKWDTNVTDHLAKWVRENCEGGSDYLTVSHDNLSIVGHKNIFEEARQYFGNGNDDYYWGTQLKEIIPTVFITPEPIVKFSLGEPFSRHFYGFASQEAEWRKKLAEQILAGH